MLVEELITTFRTISNGHDPFPYQKAVADSMFERRNAVVTAPTGAGKTFAVLAPFLCNREAIGLRRLIYVLPLRTLAQGVLHEARAACELVRPEWKVTIQTGEQPEDPFFHVGDIIVTTFDQLLSGFLCQPYGQSEMQYNMNAAAVWGNLVVFDEFHLMETSKAFVTAVSCMELFREYSRSVWMTATATSPLKKHLESKLDAVDVRLSVEELRSLMEGRGIQRALRKVEREITAGEVLAQPEERTLVVVNQVKRAQNLFEELVERAKSAGFDRGRIVLLHARFFASDRERKRRRLYELLGKDSREPAIVVATQVVEAGLDLSATRLMTEICPMNALVQRAGRCARFGGQTGTVIAYQTSGDCRPYEKEEVVRTWNTLRDVDQLSHGLVEEWVNAVHEDEDAKELSQSGGHFAKCVQHIREAVPRKSTGGVAEFIRGGSDTIRVIVHDRPIGKPREWESIPVYRNALRFLEQDLSAACLYDPMTGDWRQAAKYQDVKATYVVALDPKVARYTESVGLQLGVMGEDRSRKRPPPERQPFVLKMEKWVSHSQHVWNEAKRGLEDLMRRGCIAESAPVHSQLASALRAACLLHDLGKLQEGWQAWAEQYERLRKSDYTHTAPLAHTTFDSSSMEDRERGKLVGMKRPRHSAASAVYGLPLLQSFAANCSKEWKAMVTIAIVSHHGGWFGTSEPLQALTAMADQAIQSLAKANGLPPPTAFSRKAARESDVERTMTCFHPVSIHFETLWPITALLMRSLRLADRKATEESSAND